MQDLIQDKEETWVRQGEDLGGVIMCEGEAQRKECLIAALKDEVSALRLQLAQSSQSDPDVRHKLNNLARDIQEKKEEIQQLKEQMLEMQKNSGELVAQAVAEREQRISSLRAQLANLKSENSKCTALVNSLQRDLVAREKQTLKLAAEVDKLRQDVRYKDAQLSNMATKLSQMKETEKHQEEFLAQEKEVESLKKTVERLERTLREKQNELKQQNTERDSLKHRLELMTQEQVSVQTEMSRLKVLQQHTLQREEKAQTELRHSQTRLENLFSQIKKCILLTSETVSEKEVLEHLSELAEQKEEFRSRMKELEQQLQEHTDNQKLVEEDSEKLKARLAEWQIHAKKVCMMDAIQSQISALQDESVCPAVSWVLTHTLSILTSLHTLLQDAVNRLQAAGIEVSERNGGVSGAIQALCHQCLEIQAELKNLKAEKEQLEEREAQAGELQDSLEAMKQELELQKLQVAERQTEMENIVKLQLEKMKTDLESARIAEVALRLEMETRQADWIAKLEEAKEKERELREKVRKREKQEEQWRERKLEEEEREREWLRQMEEALQRGAEEERERIRVEIDEYREQVRQHAHTIVAMEKQVSTAQQRGQEMQEERDSLTQQLTEALSRLEEDKPSIALEQSKEQQQLEQTVTSLRASLGASQQEVVRQGEVITSLSRDLAHAHARLSDLTGELSEQQKMELETHKALVVDQRMQLSMLTQKLTMTSQLLEQKDEELKTLREKLIQTEKDLKSKTVGQEYTSLVPLLQTKDASLMVSPSDLTPQSSKGKSHRHEEMIRQQRETLAEMRARIRAVEQKWPSKLLGQQVEPVMQGRMKTHRPQRFKAQRGSISSVSGFAFPEALSEAALERTARLDMSDALELSERTYVDLARALCEALELSQGQLSGCVPLKHLPPAERERLASLRQDDLELFRNRLALQNSQSQNTHLLLQQSQREIHTLRESQAAGQQLQAELDSVHTDLEAMKQESAALRQALQLTKTQLQNHRDQSSTKNRKGIDGKSGRIGHHNCIPNDNYDKVSVLKRRQQQDRRRRREAEVDVLKSEPGHKEQAVCKMAAQLTSVPQQQQSIELTEAH
ncbi:forkhead-associated domain-containing protein 1 isoform X2 [Colossoma macropomum]|nr:forkhead-associated domain-containing protein 1 isoform X2 [Colossoma macropomum]